jgi:hypothetical protein
MRSIEKSQMSVTEESQQVESLHDKHGLHTERSEKKMTLNIGSGVNSKTNLDDLPTKTI